MISPLPSQSNDPKIMIPSLKNHIERIIFRIRDRLRVADEMVLCVGRALLELVGDSIVCELVAADGAAERLGYALEACGDCCRADEEHGGGDEARLHLCLCVCVCVCVYVCETGESDK